MTIFVPQKQNLSLFEKHRATIDTAINAVHQRSYYAAYPEMPSPAVYGETAEADQKQKFEAQLGNQFTRLKQKSDGWKVGSEQSPYTMQALGISYPVLNNAAEYVKCSQAAWDEWRQTDVETRAGILVESLERLKSSFYELAFATMHTTGQSYMMSFQASGPHAADRALEAIALGYQELKRFPAQFMWEKPAGKVTLKLEKFITSVPKGVSLAIGCATFPTWNSVPGIFASLITGNPVISKPHPKAVYPIALVIAHLQDVLVENGFSPNIALLAVDTDEKLLTKELAENPAVKIIDFTGSSTFGDYIEQLPGKCTFTEKAGVNSVILDSVADLKAMAQNVAFSACLYSGQMCTAPQNIFVPMGGMTVSGGKVTFDDVVKAIIEGFEGIINHPKMGPPVLAALQSEATQKRVMEAKALGGEVLLETKPLANPEFPNARTATPVIMKVSASNYEIFSREMFGPIVFIVETKDTEESVKLASSIANEQGSISCGAYTTDEKTMQMIAEKMANSGTPVSFNLTGGIYVNQHAGFSDFHVTGGNPAGNACFTDPEFVLKRFTRSSVRVNLN